MYLRLSRTKIKISVYFSKKNNENELTAIDKIEPENRVRTFTKRNLWSIKFSIYFFCEFKFFKWIFIIHPKADCVVAVCPNAGAGAPNVGAAGCPNTLVVGCVNRLVGCPKLAAPNAAGCRWPKAGCWFWNGDPNFDGAPNIVLYFSLRKKTKHKKVWLMIE